MNRNMNIISNINFISKIERKQKCFLTVSGGRRESPAAFDSTAGYRVL